MKPIRRVAAAKEQQGPPPGYEEYARYVSPADSEEEDEHMDEEKRKEEVFNDRRLGSEYCKYDQFIVNVQHPARWDDSHPVTDDAHYRMELTIFIESKHKWMNKIANWNRTSGAFIADIQMSSDKKNLILLINEDKKFEKAYGETYGQKTKERETAQHEELEQRLKEKIKTKRKRG